MAEWALKRFWTEVDVIEEADGFTVRLDGRLVRSPAKTRLVVPTRALAEAIAAEWQAQEAEIRPATMPFTRMANAALDKVTPQRREVADLLAAYGETDLLCYRAEAPEELRDRQAAAWDPLLDWAAERYGARLRTVSGVMPVTQDPAACAALARQVHGLDVFRLAGFHDLVSLSGSLVLALATLSGHAPAADLWELSRVDERWQEEKWGADEEATQQAMLRRSAYLDAARFCEISA